MDLIYAHQKMIDRRYSQQFIANNKRFKIRANISQRKSGFCTQKVVLLKLSLLHVHVRGAAMLYRYFVCTHSICEKCIFNMPIYLSYLMLIISINIPYSCQFRIFWSVTKVQLIYF